jgi:hypothetical protein
MDEKKMGRKIIIVRREEDFDRGFNKLSNGFIIREIFGLVLSGILLNAVKFNVKDGEICLI